jgi:hypothetical protein
MKVYQIYNPHTGLYGGGGIRPLFSTTGKAWQLGGLKSHLKLGNSTGLKAKYYEGCVILEIDCELITSSGKIHNETSRKTLMEVVEMIRTMQEIDEEKAKVDKIKQDREMFDFLKAKYNW